MIEKPLPLTVLSNSQFYVLEWILNNDGQPVGLSKGKTLDALLHMKLVKIKDGDVFITPAGREVLRGQLDT